ncbi:MAG: methyltransferase domain-containing protein [Gallionella sp.]
MTSQLLLNPYKQKVADLYTSRADSYDASDWHLRIAHHLVEEAKLKSGQRVLDVATGTGMAALKAAQIVGPSGSVVAVDISLGMLEQAKKNAQSMNLNSIQFKDVDAEALEFTEESFDHIFCSCALIWMSDVQQALSHWFKFIKPGGQVCFHAFSDSSFVGGVVLQNIVEKYGVTYLMSKPTGTVEKCQALLRQAGFQVRSIEVEHGGEFITLNSAQSMWWGSSHPAPGQHPNPLLKLSVEQLRGIRSEFDDRLRVMETERGVWNEITTFYVYGRKPL